MSTSVRMAKFKRLTISSVDKDVKQLELSYTSDRNVKWYNHFGQVFLKSP